MDGIATITYSFEMPSGEAFDAEQDFCVGTPKVWGDEITFTNGNGGQGYLCRDLWGNEFSFPYLCDYNHFEYKLTTVDETQTISQLITTSTNGMLDLPVPTPGFYKFWIRPISDCGVGDWTKKVVEYKNCSQGGFFSLSILPNPTASKATIELKQNIDIKETAKEKIEWELEIYDQSFMLKNKHKKLKAKKKKISTHNWKEGTYMVRAKVNGTIVTEKLIIKKN